MLACGTTTCEIKSGYGLSLEPELKILRSIAELAREHAIEIVSTFLGAHEVPIDFRNQRDAYIDLVVEEMIPAVAQERLAQWCDVFCETGVFTPSESHRVSSKLDRQQDCPLAFTPTSWVRAAVRGCGSREGAVRRPSDLRSAGGYRRHVERGGDRDAAPDRRFLSEARTICPGTRLDCRRRSGCAGDRRQPGRRASRRRCPSRWRLPVSRCT